MNDPHRKIAFFTDPHIGVRRVANTTPQSAKKFKETVFESAKNAVAQCRAQADVVLCLGDLFDTFTNSEQVILQGLEIARSCDMVVGGNHDITARRESVASLDLVDEAGKDDVFISKAPFNEPYYEYFQATVEGDEATCGVFTIPHVTTQDLFDQSLLMAKQAQAEGEQSGDSCKILLLHCNYDMHFEMTDTSLVLSKEQAVDLVDAGFDYILLGHEHVPREDLNGRLVVLGNTLPLAMHEAGPRRIAVLDIPTKKLEFQELPSLTRLDITDAQHAVGESGHFMVDQLENKDQVGFIDVKGEVDAADFAALQRAVRKLWAEFPNLVAVRNQIVLEGAMTKAEDSEVLELVPLQERIRGDLREHPDMLSIYDEILQELEQ